MYLMDLITLIFAVIHVFYTSQGNWSKDVGRGKKGNVFDINVVAIYVWKKHLCFLGTTEIVILEVVLSEEKLSIQFCNFLFFQ